MKKRILMAFIILLQNIAFADDSTINEAQKIANEYTKKIQDNNGSLKVDADGVYFKSITYNNNELNYQIIYNKDELVASWQKKMNMKIEDTKKYLESKEFYNRIMKLQKSNNVVSYCNPNNNPITKLVRDGMKISFNIKWNDKTNFLNYIFSQETCNKLALEYENKRQKERKNFIEKNSMTLYTLSIYKLNLTDKYKAIRKYYKLKKKNLKADEVIKVYGKDLNFDKDVNYKIMQGGTRGIINKLKNGQYIMIEVMEK